MNHAAAHRNGASHYILKNIRSSGLAQGMNAALGEGEVD